jgi:hypothetical protein
VCFLYSYPLTPLKLKESLIYKMPPVISISLLLRVISLLIYVSLIQPLHWEDQDDEEKVEGNCSW